MINNDNLKGTTSTSTSIHLLAIYYLSQTLIQDFGDSMWKYTDVLVVWYSNDGYMTDDYHQISTSSHAHLNSLYSTLYSTKYSVNQLFTPIWITITITDHLYNNTLILTPHVENHSPSIIYLYTLSTLILYLLFNNASHGLWCSSVVYL